MNRPLSAPASDIALVLTRVIFAVVMLAHGWEKMFIKGIGRTSEGFEQLNVPLAIVSASFVTVMEVAGALLILAGAFTTIVSALYLFEFVGAIVFVHGEHGLFVKEGGAEYVMIICALALALMASGPGRWSVDRWVRDRQGQRDRELAHIATAPVTVPDPTTTGAQPMVPVMQQAPVTYRVAAPGPLVLPAPFAPGPDEVTAHVPVPNSAPEHSGPLPVRRSRPAHASR